MGNQIEGVIEEEFEDDTQILEVRASDDIELNLDEINWIEGKPGPSSYSLLVVFDESFTDADPHEEARLLKQHVRECIPSEVDGFVEVEPMGHGVFMRGEYERSPVLAVLVEG